MDNIKTLSLKNRRVLVVIFFITLMTPFITLYLMAEKLQMTFLWLIPLGLLILNGTIAFFIKSRSDVFFIAAKDSKLDERQAFVRIKAQRDAYQFLISSIMLILPAGYQYFKDDAWTYIILLFCITMLLYIYLPIMLIAWQEKEV